MNSTGSEGLLDALAVIDSSKAEQVIPVALAHSGWIAIELRRLLAPRIPKIVLCNWSVTDPPPAFMAAVKGPQDPDQWQEMRGRPLSLWFDGVNNPEAIQSCVALWDRPVGEMWQRSGREIEKDYAKAGNPLRAMTELVPALPVLHLCQLQPQVPAWTVQEDFAASHPWFHRHRLHAPGHFAVLEIPGEMTRPIEAFVESLLCPSVICKSKKRQLLAGLAVPYRPEDVTRTTLEYADSPSLLMARTR